MQQLQDAVARCEPHLAHLHRPAEAMQESHGYTSSALVLLQGLQFCQVTPNPNFDGTRGWNRRCSFNDPDAAAQGNVILAGSCMHDGFLVEREKRK